MLLVCTTAFADNSTRIKELQEEGKTLLEKRQQYTQVMQQIDMRLVEIQGAVKELQNQDKPQDKPEEKK
jgi:hypothetical protein